MIFGRIIAWMLDTMVISFLSIVAFATWSSSQDLGVTAWILFLSVLTMLMALWLTHQVRTGTSMQEVAKLLDEKLGFKDRLSSALMFSNSEHPNEFMLAHIDETNDFLKKTNHTILPIRLPRRSRAYVLFVAIVLVSILPHEDRVTLRAVEKRIRVQNIKHDAMKIAEELDDIRVRSDMLGLKKLSSMVKEVHRAISDQMDILPPQDPDELKNSDTPMKSSTEKAHDGPGIPVMQDATNAAGANPRFSRISSYRPVGRFDAFPEESYSEVFSELDKLIISDDFLTSKELQTLSDHIDDVAGKLGNFGYFKDEQATTPQAGPGPQYGQMDPEESGNPFKTGLAPLQYKAFSEFLKRYAAHLGEKALGKAHREELAGKNTKSKGKVVNISMPPPKSGKFTIQSTSQKPRGPILQATQKQAAKVASQLQSGGKTITQYSKNSLKVTGGGTQPGGKGAGVGSSGGARSPNSKVIPRASGGEYLPLEGKLSDGRTVIQIIDAKGKKRLGSIGGPESSKITYNEIFKGYAQGAQAELAGEAVPLQMRDYVRQYFLSIRPKVKPK